MMRIGIVATIALLVPGALTAQPRGKVAARATIGPWGIDTSSLSRTIRPGDDFYHYVNEGWIRSAKIPSNGFELGAFTEVALATEARIRSIVLDASRSRSGAGTPLRQIGDLYRSFVDTITIARRGLGSIRKDLDRIVAMRTHEEVARWMANPTSSSLVAINVFPDAGDTRRQLVHLDQNNLLQPILGLPNRNYYLDTTGAFPARRDGYRAYVAATLRRAGITDADRRAATLLALETAIAERQWDFERLRDRKANYHLIRRDALAGYAPGFPWDAFLESAGVSDVTEVVLGTDSAVQAQARLFADTPVDSWASYLAFHWIQNQVDLLPDAFGAASFAFFGRQLNGVAKREDRQRRGVQLVNRTMGESVGQLYVGRFFPPAYLARAEELFGYLTRAFAERVDSLDWMDDSTRTKAREKLAAFRLKVGHPLRWRSYAQVTIDPRDLVGNIRRVRDDDWALSRAKLSAATGLDWYQSPQTVNASFSTLLNAIELPAAILQPPFFDPFADPAVNFGSIGAIIGHEMGHGYDDQGANFDGQGRIVNWWTDGSRRQFSARSAALVAQYGEYAPLPGLHLDGRRGLGENIGDLTGVAVAHRAYQLYLRDHGGGSAPVLNGFTGDQRFFLAWAQTWHYVGTEDAMRRIVSSGYHAPSQYRVNGVVRNLDAWYAAFAVEPKDRLYLAPERRVRLW